MSDESIALGRLTRKGEEDADNRFSQEHYSRLMEGQKPWRKFRKAWEGEGDPWKAFAEDNPDEAVAIRENIEAWNATPPAPALLKEGVLDWAHLEGADLSHAHLERAKLTRAHLEGANLMDAHLEGADLGMAHMEGATLYGAHMEGAKLYDAHLEGANLVDAHLEGVNLLRASITATTALGVLYGPNHEAMHDDSDTIFLPSRDRHLNWGVLRRIGGLPLFEVSYGALAISIVTINAVGYLNRTQVSQWFEYPIEMPARMTWLFVSALFLGIGTTLYRLRCPERVQTFSETEWVEQHGRPRLQYLAESLKRRG